jgi:hypothetical protein
MLLSLFHPLAILRGERVEKWGVGLDLDLYSKLVHLRGKLTGIPRKSFVRRICGDRRNVRCNRMAIV